MRRLKCGDNFGITYTSDKIVCSVILQKDTTIELINAVDETILQFAEEIGVEPPEPIRISKVPAACLDTGFYVEQHIFDISNSLYDIEACAQYIVQLYNFYNNSDIRPEHVH